MSSAPMQPHSPTPSPAPRAKKKRWLRRIALALAAMIVLIAVLVQIVLATDLPRGIVVKQIEGQLGLRMGVKSLTTGWLGHTQLNDVTIGLPLADQSFVTVPVMKVKNTSLFGLILGQSVEVEAIELDSPHVYVVQDASGRWNLQQVAELLARAGGKKPGEESANTSSRPQMPRVHITNGAISIVDNQRRALEVQPLSVDGYADSPVSWTYDIEAPSHMSVKGRLVPGGDWSHEVAVHLQNLDDWARPWKRGLPQAVVDVQWRGALTKTGIGGRLMLNKVSVALGTGPAEAYGAVSIAAGAGGVTVRPENLLLKPGIQGAPNITLASGAIIFDPTAKSVRADQLLVSAFGGAVKVAANYDLTTSAAHVNVGWDRLALASDIVHSGALDVSLSRPFPDKIIVDGHITSVGNRGPAQWLVSAGFNASGQSFDNFLWRVTADKFQWQRNIQGINLDGLALAGVVTPDVFRLTSASMPNRDLLSGTAAYQLKTGQSWEMHLEGQRWPFKPLPGTELGFVFDARGDKTQIRLDNFEIKSPDALVSINALYTFGQPKPLSLNFSMVNAPPRQAPVAVAAAPEARLFSGTIDSHFSVAGTLDPLKLEVRGELDGREIDFRDHHLGNVQLVMAKESHIDSNGLFLYTEWLSMFGGKWDLDAVYVPDWNDLTLNVEMQNIALRDIAVLAADRDDITGTLDGHVRVAIPRLNLAANNIIIPPASFTLRNVAFQTLAIDQIDATLAMQRGHLLIDPIHLKRAEGTGDVRVAVDLGDYRKIDIKTKISAWPVDIEGALAHVNASVDIPDARVELPDANAVDPARREIRVSAPRIDLNASTTLKGEHLGDFVAHAGIDGRKLDIRGVHMQLLGGRLDGQAFASLDKPLSSTAEFTWENLDFKKMALIFPRLSEMSGTLTGILRVAPTNVPRPREPLALVLTSTLSDGAWRTVPVHDLRLAAYIGPNEQEFGGGWRMVMEDSPLDPSFIHAADGTIGLWGRAGFGGRASSSQGQITLTDLDLNKIVHALEPAAAQMPGRIGGNIMLVRSSFPARAAGLPYERMFPGRPARVVSPIAAVNPNDPPLKALLEPIYAEGDIKLTKANLAAFPPFAALYNAGNLFQNVNAPNGFGNVEFRLERGAVNVQRMRYFYQGTEIRAVATVRELWNSPNEPVNAVITLLARPLSNAKIPFFSDLDTALTAIQKSLPVTAVRVTGTLHSKKIDPLGFSQLGRQMQDFLVGDARSGG